MKILMKAQKSVQELVALRKEAGHQEYAVLEAPFYFMVGNLLTTYIETKSDVFGNLAALEMEESSGEEEEEGEQEGDEAQKEEEGIKEAKEDEPKIEEETKKKEDIEEEKEEANPAAEGGEQQDNPAATMVEDAVENILACIQLAEDFISSGLAGGLTQRKEVISNLLIDSYIRLGDITLFREDIAGAIESFQKAVDLCREFSSGNERIQASTLFTIGCCHQQTNNNSEAAKAFTDSIIALRLALSIKLKANNQPAPDADSPTEALLKPSIFDSEEIKDMRGILQDMIDKL